MSNDLHEQELKNFCRVCARKLSKGYKHKCSNSGTLLERLGVQISKDESTIHPPFYCHNCHSTAKRLERDSGAESGIVVHSWSAHSAGCEVCTMSSPLHLGRRKRKVAVKKGRPSTDSRKGVANAINRNAPETWKMTEPLSLARFLPPSSNLQLSDIQCAICHNVVDRPVTTPCGKLLCAECISSRIRELDADKIQCPSCSNMHSITPNTFVPASDLILKVLGELLLHCEQPACSAVVTLKHLREHVESGCKTTSSGFSPSKLTVGQMLSCPLQSLPTCKEQKAAANVIQRLLHTPTQSDTQATPSVIKLSTDGTPLSLLRVNHSRVSSSSASRWTLRRRSSKMSCLREFISSGASASQLQDEVTSLSENERRVLLQPASTVLSPEDTLAIKAGAVLPWNKFRLMRGYLSSRGVKLASEKSMRTVSKQIIGCDNLAGEEVPLSQPLSVGVDVVLAPLVYVPDLRGKIFQLLDQNDSVNRLTWHNGLIPESEVWVKIGGDRGGDTVKIVFQICNVLTPNSIQNTCVFCVFEGKDTTTNLHIALDRYQSQFEELKTAKWRGKSLRFFLTGDYEFLSRIYGITGAQGRHPCLWCTIPSGAMKVPREDRPEFVLRTLHTLEADLLQFQTAGKGNIKKAKEYNNVIGKHFFPISLDQVCPPGLHISLGIFYKIWCLLEEGCHELDLELAKRSSHTPTDPDTFQQYSALVKKLTHLRENKMQLVQLVSSLNAVLGDLAINSGSSTLVQALTEEVQTQATNLEKLEREITTTEQKCGEGFPIHDGPFIRCLDKTLGELNIHREAYYGGTFTGNNVHRCLKAVNLDKLCSAIPHLATEKCPELEDQAQTVMNKYGRALLLFAKCHNIFNSSRHFDNSDLSTLLGDIDEFLRFYHHTFPDSSISPKLHMLEDHVVPFIRKWRVGLGMLNEQGAESIHARFNTLQRTYGSMQNKVERLKCTVKEHFRQICPDNLSRIPPTKRRKESDETK